MVEKNKTPAQRGRGLPGEFTRSTILRAGEAVGTLVRGYGDANIANTVDSPSADKSSVSIATSLPLPATTLLATSSSARRRAWSGMSSFFQLRHFPSDHSHSRPFAQPPSRAGSPVHAVLPA